VANTSIKLRKRVMAGIKGPATLTVKVESAATDTFVNGDLRERGDGVVDTWKHGTLFNRTRTVELRKGRDYVAAVEIDFLGTRTESAIVHYTVTEADDSVRAWDPEVEGRDIDLAETKLILGVE
jgi:hypothetical protein